jgi:hypothetical protein
MVSIIHGVEHYTMNSSLAPFYLPQRIRSFYDEDRKIEDYSIDVDKQNAYIGNYLFTQVKTDGVNPYYWVRHTSSIYNFKNKHNNKLCDKFIKNIKKELICYDKYFRCVVDDVISNTGKVSDIPVKSILEMGISISM